MSDQAAQQRPFTGNANVPLSRDASFQQSGVPLCDITELDRTLAKILHHGRCQLLLFPEVHRALVDHIVRMRLTDEFQEVEPAFAISAIIANAVVGATLSSR